MSKTTLKASIENFKRVYANYTDEAKKISSSTAYTPEGRKQAAADLTASKATEIRVAGDHMLCEFDKACESISNRKAKAIRSNLTDAGSAAGLQNAVDAVKRGALHTAEEMQAVIDVFKDDPISMELLRSTANSPDCKTAPEALEPLRSAKDGDLETLKKFRSKSASMATAAAAGNLSEYAIMNFDAYLSIIENMNDF